MQNDFTPQRTLLRDLLAKVEEDPGLAAELARARREFFGADQAEYLARGTSKADRDRMDAAANRFAEWFLLERESDVLGEVPVRALAERMGRGDEAEDLEASVAGVFVVDRVAGGEVRVRDLQDERSYDLEGVRAATVSVGDVLVGRLFPLASGAYLPSQACVVEPRGRELAEAFRQDLVRLGLQRRLNQAELERVMVQSLAQQRAQPFRALERVEADLDAFLRHAGRSPQDIRRLLEALAAAERPAVVMGPLLEELAFDTNVDLELARRLLLEAWNAYHARGRAPAPAPRPAPPEPDPPIAGAGPTLGSDVAARIERGLARGQDVEDVFAEVEGMLGVDPSEDEDEDAAALDPFTIGDLEPLVYEYLWETATEDTAGGRALRRLVEMQHEAPVPKTNLEYLEAEDLTRFLLQVYLQSPPEQRHAAVAAAHDTLHSFFAWGEATQDFRLQPTLQECDRAFYDHVERLAAASLALSSTVRPRAGERPQLFRVLAVGDTGTEVLLIQSEENLLLPGPAGLAARLHPGDLLLGLLDRSGKAPRLHGMVVAMPGSVERMLG